MAAEEGSQREMEEFIAGTGIFGGEEQPEAEETGETVHDLPPDQQPAPDDGAETPPPSPSRHRPRTPPRRTPPRRLKGSLTSSGRGRSTAPTRRSGRGRLRPGALHLHHLG
jgi:hypothetical protein